MHFTKLYIACAYSVLLLLVLNFSTACSKDKVAKFEEPFTPIFIDSLDTIRFSTQVQPIIQQNCAVSGCHNASAAGSYVLQNHAQISAHANIMLKAIKWDPSVQQMPQGAPKLSDSLIAIFENWILQGKMNN